MTQIYFLGDTCSKGTYYFYSTQQKGWVVSDLDLGKSYLCDGLILIETLFNNEYIDTAVGQFGRKHLIKREDLPSLSKYLNSDEYITISQCYPDGSISTPSEEVKQIDGVIRKLREKFSEKYGEDFNPLDD